MSKYYPAGGGTYTLSASIGSTDVTIQLTSFTEPISDVAYTMALLNTDIAYGTIGPKTSSSEFISFTGITQNGDGTATLTGVTRGLAKKYPFTSSATFQLPHSGQSVFILSDMPQVFVKYISLENAEMITGKKTFPGGGNASAPVSGTVYAVPTADLEYASKKYVDDTAVSGAPDASLTVKGLVEIATTSEINAGTATGGTGASIAVRPDQLTASVYGLQLPSSGQKSALASTTTPGASNKYVTQTDFQINAERFASSTTGNDTYVATFSPAIASVVNGMELFLKVDTANTGAATLNPNGLGATSILRIDGSALADGDIPANGIAHLIYNSTSTAFRLQNLANAPKYNSNITTRAGNAASGAQTIAHGLGRAPRSIKITVTKAFGSGAADDQSNMFSAGTYNGTTTATIYSSNDGGVSVSGGTDVVNIINIVEGVASGVSQVATATFDATNITLTFTKTGSPDSANLNILWEAFA